MFRSALVSPFAPCLLVLASVFPVAAWSANLTLTKALIDSRNGVIDFRHPAIAHSLGPGDTVFIEGHTRPSLTLINLTYGTAAQPVTVTNSGPVPLVIHNDTGGGGIRLWGMQNVIFKGSPVGSDIYGTKVTKTTTQSSGASPSGIEVDYNQEQRGDVTDGYQDTRNLEIAFTEVANTAFAGIMAKYSLNEVSDATKLARGYPQFPRMDGLNIHHNLIRDTHGEGMYVGWTSDGKAPLANVSIHHNILKNIGWDGIQLNRAKGANAVFDNVVETYGMSSTTAASINQPFSWHNEGIQVGSAAVDIYNNKVKGNSAYSGTALFLSLYGPSRVYNNLFVHSGFNVTAPEPSVYVRQTPSGGSVAQPVAKLDMFNNTIVTPDHDGVKFESVSRPVTLFNNVIAQPLNGGGYVRSGPSPLDLSNKLFSSVADARFAGAADYRPAAGSPLVDSARNVHTAFGVYQDMEGVDRRQQGNGFDVGAYERVVAMSSQVLTPAAWGTATGSAYVGAVGAFNSQPVWNSTTGAPAGIEADVAASTGTAYANRHWYIDLGQNWGKMRITSTWTRYRGYSTGSYGGFASLWWDNDNDNVNDGIPAAGINFATAQNLPQTGNQLWVRDSHAAGTPIVPQGRYLVMATGMSPTQRANEFAIIGYFEP